MTTIVSISGKGGVGKTTVAAMMINELTRRHYDGRILAVDADPAATLALALNVAEPAATIAELRDTLKLNGRGMQDIPAGMSRQSYFRQKLEEKGVIRSCLVNGLGLDLMVMGQGEGRGCYCSVNNTLADVLKEIVEEYDMVIIDNEAGLEHLSRYRLNRIDFFLVVAGPGRGEMQVAEQVFRTAHEVGMETGCEWLIFNRYSNGASTPEPDTARSVILLPFCQTLMNGGDVAPQTKLGIDLPIRHLVGQILKKVDENVRIIMSPTETVIFQP